MIHTLVMNYRTLSEVAAEGRCCDQTVRRAIADGRLRAVKIDGRVRIAELDADRFLQDLYVARNYGPDSNERRRIAVERAAAAAQDDAADDGEAPAQVEPIGLSLEEGWSVNVLGAFNMAFGNRIAPLIRGPDGTLWTRQEYEIEKAQRRAAEERIDAELVRRDAAAAGARRSDEQAADPAAAVKESTNVE